MNNNNDVNITATHTQLKKKNEYHFHMSHHVWNLAPGPGKTITPVCL